VVLRLRTTGLRRAGRGESRGKAKWTPKMKVLSLAGNLHEPSVVRGEKRGGNKDNTAIRHIAVLGRGDLGKKA